jgi:splicing factor 45
VEFAEPAAAAAALAELHGRFFGGRAVRGRFFEAARFAAGALAPLPGEVEGYYAR